MSSALVEKPSPIDRIEMEEFRSISRRTRFPLQMGSAQLRGRVKMKQMKVLISVVDG